MLQYNNLVKAGEIFTIKKSISVQQIPEQPDIAFSLRAGQLMQSMLFLPRCLWKPRLSSLSPAETTELEKNICIMTSRTTPTLQEKLNPYIA